MNKNGLQPMGDNLYLETASSGTPQLSNPGLDAPVIFCSVSWRPRT